MGLNFVSTVSEFVADRQRAKRFDTEVLEYELRSFSSFFQG
jgi:hypothetical protein